MEPLTHKLSNVPTNLKLYAAVLTVALIAGLGTGYLMAQAKANNPATSSQMTSVVSKAGQDTKTFRDFAEGVIQKKPAPKNGQDYSEGTHLLIRQNAVPVALTSSVVDLSQYEGKKVKVFGETQKAVQEGWLMDVGKVEAE